MTEAEWLACDNPVKMLEFLKGKVSERNLRLFAVACCRRRWAWFADKKSQNAIIVAEGFANGERTELELLDAHEKAWRIVEYPGDAFDIRFLAKKIASFAASPLADVAASGVANDLIFAAVVEECGEEVEGDPSWQQQCEIAISREREELAKVLREIAHPFHELFDHQCFTSTVVSLAQTIYDEKAFDRMPILGDALEDAGCDNADMLNHCRQQGEHVRGCWVVDLILSKDR